MNNTLDLNINSDAFKGLKHGFDAVLKDTLKTMEKKEVSKADITIKLSISMHDIFFLNLNRSCRVPEFEHKITSKMQVEDKINGRMGGRFELKLNEKTGEYYLQAIKDGQTTMFEEENKNAE
ncbi:MAG: hypothetical protein K2F81_00640 [Ruminococcus sp.]|nr:hypothetical protein [Ruminococcus sp.]